MMKSARVILLLAVSACLAASCRSAAPPQESSLSDKPQAQDGSGEGHAHDMDLDAYNQVIEKFERNKSFVTEDNIFMTAAMAYLLRYIDSPVKLKDTRDLELALEYSDKAIALNNSIAKYYGGRSEVYRELGITKKDAPERAVYQNKALEDLGRCAVLATDPDISAMCDRDKVKVLKLLGNTKPPAMGQ